MEGTHTVAMENFARNEHGCLDARSLRNLGVCNKTLSSVVALSPSWAQWYQEHFQGSAAWLKTLEKNDADPTCWFRHFLVLYRKFVVQHDWDGLPPIDEDDDDFDPEGDFLAPVVFSPGFVVDESAFLVGSKLVAVSKVGPRQREMLRINVAEGRVVSKLQLLEGEVILAWDAKTQVLVGRREVPKKTAQLLLTVYDATTFEKVRTYTVAITASATPRKCRAAMDDGCIAVVMWGRQERTVMAIDRGTGTKLYQHALSPALNNMDVALENGAVRVVSPGAFFRVNAMGVQESAYPNGGNLKTGVEELEEEELELCAGPRKEIIWLVEARYSYQGKKDKLYKWDAARNEYVVIPQAEYDDGDGHCMVAWSSDGNVAPYFKVDCEPGCWFNVRCIGNNFKRVQSNSPDAYIKALICCPWMVVLLTTRAFREGDFESELCEGQVLQEPAKRIVAYDFTRTVLDQLL
jgi:hypothetical protein